MALIPAKCTQCGANIEVDDTHEAGICKYCGTAFITEKAINNYNTYITNNNNFAGATINVIGADINNLLKLAEEAIKTKNEKEALDYINRALEVDPACTDAWFLKVKAVAISASAAESKLLEMTTYGGNAIKYATPEKKHEIESKVYDFYLDHAISLMVVALVQISDTAKVSSLFKSAGVSLAAISAVQQGDAKARQLFEQTANNAINLKHAISPDYVKNSDSLQKKVKKLAELYIDFCKKDQERTKIYGLTPEDLNSRATEIRRNNLALITEGLMEENKVDEANINHAKQGGCYIATSIYGSYDCPQVWTLRRYRDDTLSKTWFGRFFIKTYYTISPTLVKWFGETQWFKKLWKPKLDRMVKQLNTTGIADTPYQDKHW